MPAAQAFRAWRNADILAFVGDREVVASIAAGDPAGLGEAYDRYAPGLHAYCRSMLREPADAADAVQDTFVIAASRLGNLRDPDRLRPWLYTVARNLCLRKLRQDKAAARNAPILGVPGARPTGSAHADPASTATDPVDLPDPSTVGDRAERAELRALVRDAAAGLTWREREILRLRLWEELGADQAAAVLGVSRDYANALFARARDRLTACIGDLLVARTGRADCAELRQILADWDGQLTVLLRKRLSRHIERCDICTRRRGRELVPALLGLSPGAAVAGIAAQGAAHGAAALKTQVLAAAARQAGQPSLAAKAGAFGPDGFPKAAHHGGSWIMHTTKGQAATAGTAAAAVVTVVALSLALALPSGHRGQLAKGTPGKPSGTGPGTGSGPGGGTPGNGGRHGSGHSGAGHPGGGTGGQPGTSPGSGGQPRAAASAPLPASGPATGGQPPATGPGGSGNTPTPGPSPTPPPPTPSPTPTPPPPSPGTVSVSTRTVLLTPLLGDTVTLTAHGGPVRWSITEPSSLFGELSLSRTSGTLAAGASTTVTIEVSGLASLDTTLAVSPGQVPVHVLIGLGLLPRTRMASRTGVRARPGA